MDDRRASTYVSNVCSQKPSSFSYATHRIEALDSFIRAQRLLLEQTQEDIAKLTKLKSYTLAKPNTESEDLIHQVAHPLIGFAPGAYFFG